MSLINEALKKAQRLRTEDAADPTTSYPAGGSGASRRGKPSGANTMVLIGSGALVLVVLSVFFTVYLVNRPSTPAPVAVASGAPVAKPAVPAPVASEPSAPAIVVPKIAASQPAPGVESSAAATPAIAVAPASASSVDAPGTPQVSVAIPSTPQPPPTTSTTPANATALPAPQTTAQTTAAAPTPELAPDAPDERVAAFVESVRVTGIRSSGAESRVLMNERVYRVNDIVERTMNVRLIKAASDSLTFSDARGVTYVKRF